MGRISNLVDGLLTAWNGSGLGGTSSLAPVSAVISASLFDVPYLAVTLPHVLRQSRFAFAERLVVIDPRLPTNARHRPYGQPAELERIVNDAMRARIIDRVIELDTSDASERTVRDRYFERDGAADGDTARSLYPALFGLEAARHDVVAWFRPDLMFHASDDSWVAAGVKALARDRDLWLTTTRSGPRALADGASRRMRTGSSRHFLCDRRRLHGRLREVDATRERLGRCVTNALERHRAWSGIVAGAWHLHPRWQGPPFPQWIERLRDSVERGVVPPNQHDGCLRLDDPVSRSAWRKLLFSSAEVTPRPSRVATLIERRAVPGSAPLSIVIPIRNRAGSDVRNALASLAWQTSGRPWEVIVVSHGSDARVDAELRSLVIDAGATLITVGRPEDPWCKALALNTGIRATDPAISFVMTMDADMLLAENMIDTVLTELRGDPEKIVLCQSSDLPQDCELPEAAETIRAQFALLAQRANVRGTYGTGGIQAVRRSFLFDVRGYDEDMLWWGAVDTDLVRRAEATGLRTSWITNRTTMLHQWHPTKHRVLEEATRKDDARNSWLRNHELMIERAKQVVRNNEAWGATIENERP